MKISVIIVSFDCGVVLARCLATLPQSAEVIVVDNASSDGTQAMVRQQFPWVHLIARTVNGGFSVAVNQAAQAAHGEAFLLLNPDTELQPAALARMQQALTATDDTWAVGFRQVDAQGFFQLAVGPTPTLRAEAMRRFAQRALDRRDSRAAWVLDHLLPRRRRVAWVAGSSLLVWRHAFARVGGFDERFFLYFEDIDFCLRLRHAGGAVYYDPSVTVLHHRGVSAARHSEFAQRAYRQSQLYFWEKYRGPWLRALMQRYLQWRGVAL